MNFKDSFFQIFFQVLLFVSILSILQYFIGWYTNKSSIDQCGGVSGQTFVAPELQKSQRPLLLDVMIEKEADHEIIDLHKVETSLGVYVFSSRGAILESFYMYWQNKTMSIPMLNASAQCFFVALDGVSPLYYKFIDEIVDPVLQVTILRYQASSEAGSIVKTFIVYHNSYRIDVKLEVEGLAQHIRLLLPMPLNLETAASAPMGGSYEVYGITNKALSSSTLTIREIVLEKSLQEFVFEPRIFGFSDRFIIHSFVQAGNQHPLRAYFKSLGDKNYQAILESTAFEKNHQEAWSFYLGPKVEQALMAVQPALNQTINYGWFSILAKPMFKILQALKDYFGNYGIAIILLTILLNLLLLPFKMRGERSMRQQADFQKKLAYVRQKYKHDKQALEAASAELIQKHGMPGFLGCLPLLLNIPFFIALSRLLSCSFDLYGAHFLWLPDLSAKDPFYILGILTGAIMLMTPAVDSKQTVMRYASALMFGTITMYLSSGLALFILTNTIMNLLQMIVTRYVKSGTCSL
ncbi:membrane protein insertase YidC [Candidatus Dependentiae bacterium]|nr:membrane protein insertase YidC [Candidatus Dependentiae bacterium]